MSDDIVTLLRREAIEGFSATDWTQLSFAVQTACDEIEALRLDVRDLRKIIELLKQAEDD